MIGTIMDSDAPIVAEEVYVHMFRFGSSAYHSGCVCSISGDQEADQRLEGREIRDSKEGSGFWRRFRLFTSGFELDYHFLTV